MSPFLHSVRFHGQNKKLTLKDEEWFCGRDVCEILGFKNANQVLLDRVKWACKSDLGSLNVTKTSCATPLSHNAGKAVYRLWIFKSTFQDPACINWCFGQIKRMTDYTKKLHTTIFTDGLWENPPCFRLDWKRMQQTFWLHYHHLSNTSME